MKFKKGFGTGLVIIFILSAIVLGVIAIFGTKMILDFKGNACDVSLVRFQDDVINDMRKMLGPGQFGSIQNFRHNFPCADNVYFFDPSRKNMLGGIGGLKKNPILLEQLDTAVEENVFVTKDDKIIGSFDVTGLKIDYPYHTCIKPKGGDIAYKIEGKGKDVRLRPSCSENECNEFVDEDVGDIVAYAEMVCTDETGFVDPACKSATAQNINNAQGQIDVKIKITECAELTRVEFKIIPSLGVAGKEVKFFEHIKKECVPDLRDFLERVEGGGSGFDIIMQADPIMVWSFDNVATEEVVAYEINKFLSDECKRNLKATVGAEMIVNTDDPDILSLSKADIRLSGFAGSEAPDHPDRFRPDHTDALPIKVEDDKKGKRIKVTDRDDDGDGRPDVVERPPRGESDPPVVDLSGIGVIPEIPLGAKPDLLGLDIFTGIDFRNLISDDITDFDDLDIDLVSDVGSDIDCEVTQDGKVNCEIGEDPTLIEEHTIEVIVKNEDNKESRGSLTVKITA